jgi:hypothetical protein
VPSVYDDIKLPRPLQLILDLIGGIESLWSHKMKQHPAPSHLAHATGAPVTDNLNIQTVVAGERGAGSSP